MRYISTASILYKPYFFLIKLLYAGLLSYKDQYYHMKLFKVAGQLDFDGKIIIGCVNGKLSPSRSLFTK